MRVLIVGAGIGGLTCAIALRGAGADVEVVERTADLAGIGAGISLWPNALAALGELGIEAEVCAGGIEFASGTIRRPTGEPFNIFEPELMRRYFGGMPVMMHRADLQRILLDAAEDIDISLGTRCEDVATVGNKATAGLSDGSTRSADVVVGADGVRSAVRASVEPSRPRYVGLSAWRAVITTVATVEDSWLTVGRGKQFLATPLSDGRTYVSGLVPLREGALDQVPHLGPFLKESFRDWHDPIAQLIDDTPEEAYIRGDVYDRPRPSRLCWDRVVLVGDAAHPVTPDLGQGGCLAIEDAVVLGRCLRSTADVPRALELYERTRLPRVRTIAFESHWTGRVFASANPVIESIRSTVLRGMPTGVRLRHLARYASRDAFLKSLPPRGEPIRG